MTNLVQERAEREIGEHDAVLFMKRTPVFPQCGFSAEVVQILSRLGVEFKALDALKTHSSVLSSSAVPRV
jgi:monothiol glutaredoxin